MIRVQAEHGILFRIRNRWYSGILLASFIPSWGQFKREAMMMKNKSTITMVMLFSILSIALIGCTQGTGGAAPDMEISSPENESVITSSPVEIVVRQTANLGTQSLAEMASSAPLPSVVEFYVDDKLIGTDEEAEDGYWSISWNPELADIGTRTISTVAKYDDLEDSNTIISVNVASSALSSTAAVLLKDKRILDIMQTEDNNFIVSGSIKTTNDGTTEYTRWLAMLDNGLNITWEKTFSPAANNSFNGARLDRTIQLSENEYLATNIYYRSAENVQEAVHHVAPLIKFDGDGNKLWAKNLLASRLNKPSGIQAIDSENIFFATWEKLTSSRCAFSIIKIGEDGTVISSNTYKAPSTASIIFGQSRYLGITSDGNLMYISSRSSSGGSYIFVKIGVDGNVIWSKELTFDNESSTNARDIMSTSDGGYILNMLTWPNVDINTVGDTHYTPVIVKVDSDINLKWAKKINSQGYMGEAIAKTSQGDAIVSMIGPSAEMMGLPSDDDSSERVRSIIMIGSDGSVIWQREYPYFSSEIILESEDGKILSGGSDSANPAGETFNLIKTNADGLFDASCAIDATNSSIPFTPYEGITVSSIEVQMDNENAPTFELVDVDTEEIDITTDWASACSALEAQPETQGDGDGLSTIGNANALPPPTSN
jgi:Big-like domain-containing protein